MPPLRIFRFPDEQSAISAFRVAIGYTVLSDIEECGSYYERIGDSWCVYVVGHSLSHQIVQHKAFAISNEIVVFLLSLSR